MGTLQETFTPFVSHRVITTPQININWRVVRRYGDGIVAGIVLAIIVFSVVFAGQVTPYHPTADMDLRNRMVPPVWNAEGTSAHLLGTDSMGRDLLARTLHGGQISLKVAFIASTISSVVGIAYGLVSGYSSGTVDRVMSRITDVWISFPFLVLALAVIAVTGTSSTILIALLALAGWVYPARVTRAKALSIRELEYVQAASAMGASDKHIILRHILPNVISVNIVLWTFSMGTLVIIEGSLSFLGLGVSPPTPSWGNMLNDGRAYLQDAWWLSVFPGLALMLTVLCVNTVGDSLQKFMNRWS